MLPADNVVQLKREARVFFMDETILAASACALSHFDSKGLADITGHEEVEYCRAWHEGSGEPLPWPFS